MNHEHEHSGSSDGHQMYFNVSHNLTFLFSFFAVDSLKYFILACSIVFILTIVHTGLIFIRKFIKEAFANKIKKTKEEMLVESGGGGGERVISNGRNRALNMKLAFANHLVQTGLHVIQMGLSLLLMLLFMTFNLWVCLSIIVGATVGYFVFNWKLPEKTVC